MNGSSTPLPDEELLAQWGAPRGWGDDWMVPMKTWDTLIVGAGLAGLLLAREWRCRGRKVALFHDPAGATSSEVAAGVLNPVTGHRLVRSWRVEEFLPQAKRMYQQLEQALGGRYYYEMPIRRCFLSAKDLERHAERRSDPAYRPFLGPAESASLASMKRFQAPLGSFLIEGVGYVDLPRLLADLREEARAVGSLVEERFDYGAVQWLAEGIAYRGWGAREVVFSEGAGVRHNPWFKDWSFRPVKGEILTVKAEVSDWPPVILHHRKWILPWGKHTFRIGSTYDRGDKDPAPTASAREALLKGWREVWHEPPPTEVIDHQAGIRPATHDTRPYLGRHPEFPRAILCNGFGSKGALLVPWSVQHLMHHLEEGAVLDPELDCHRGQRSGEASQG